MDSSHSRDDLNHQEVLPINQLGGNAAKTVQLSASKGEHHNRGQQPSCQLTEVIVMGPTFDQQVAFEDDEGFNMEPLISDPKAKPMRYAGWLSFLQKFIFVPNQSNQIWRLRLLSATCLIMFVVVGILFYPDDLHKAKSVLQNQHINEKGRNGREGEIGSDFTPSTANFSTNFTSIPSRTPPLTSKFHGTGASNHYGQISVTPQLTSALFPSHRVPPSGARPKRNQGPLDSPVQDFYCPLLPASLQANFSGYQISVPPNNTGMVECAVDYTDLTNQVYVHNYSKQENKDRSDLVHPRRDLSALVDSSIPYIESGSRIKVSLPGRTNHQISLPDQHNTGAGESIISFILGPNRSDPIWQLRLLAAFSLVVHTTIGVLFLPEDLQRVHTTYWRVILITIFGALVAVITLLVSFWLVPDSYGRSNWITGLSVTNFSMLGGCLAVYWILKRVHYKNLTLSVRVKNNYCREYTDGNCYSRGYRYYRRKFLRRYRQY